MENNGVALMGRIKHQINIQKTMKGEIKMFLGDRLRPTELRQWESPGLGYIFCKQGKTFLIMLKQYYPMDSLEEFSFGVVHTHVKVRG